MKRAALGADDLLGPDLIPPPWPGHHVDVDGANLFVRETAATRSDAEPALYVHGLGGSSHNWTDLAGLLADRLDGHAVDLPGFGRSEPIRNYSIASLARVVTRYLELTDRGPVHLFGNSLGGAVAVRVAGLRPDLVRTLTLVSPAMPFLDPRRSLQGRVVPLLALPQAHRLAERLMRGVPPEEMAAQVMEACFADTSRVPDQRRREAIEEIRIRYEVTHYAEAYVQTLRGLVSSFLRAYLPGANSMWRIAAQIGAPTLVVGGRQDRLVDIRVAPTVAKAIPDSRLLILDGVGHVAQMEVPRIVARAAIALLDEVAIRESAPAS